MIRSIIPLIALFLFFLEPVFSLFSPIALGDEFYILVPRFVIIYFIFITVYYRRKTAITYGIIFGLLYDMFYIDIIGLYAFLYPMICLIASFFIRYIYKHIVTVILLTLCLVALLEFFSYGFASLIDITSIELKEFLSNRLLPTLIANSIFVIMFGWFFKRFIDSKMMRVQGETL